MDSENKQRISLYLDKDLVASVDKFIDEYHYKSRNDFFSHAAEYYLALDEMKKNETLRKMFGDACKIFADENAKALGYCLYRYAVDIDVITRMLSNAANYTQEEVATYRREAKNNVRRTKGRIHMDDIATGYYQDFAEEGE